MCGPLWHAKALHTCLGGAPTAKGNDFRSNIHQGGKAENITLPDHYVDLALTAAQTLNLDVAGVDILETNDGPVIIEVNPSPGLEAIETTTNIDIAGKIVDYIEQRLKQNLLPSSPSVLV